MLWKAATDFNVDLSKSWMIGDGENDVLAGKNARCKGGYGFARMTVEYDRTGNSTVRVFDENNHETMKKSLHVNEIIQ